MTDEEKIKLLLLLDSISKKLTNLEQKLSAVEKENWSMATHIVKLENRINELESDSNV